MTRNHLIRLIKPLMLAAIAAALAAPASALPGSNPGKPTPDWYEFYRYVAPRAVALGNSNPAASTHKPTPAWFEFYRYVAPHPYGKGVLAADTSQARDPVDRMLARERAEEMATRIRSERAAIAASVPERVTVQTGFHWGEFSIGAGAMVGLVLLAAIGSIATRMRRTRGRLHST